MTISKHSRTVEAARELFIKFSGRRHRQIESEMRSMGFTKFSRRCFYNRKRNGKTSLGWIEKFGWSEKLIPDDFQTWLKAVSPTMNWDWRHLKLVCEKLQDVNDGKCKRLMLFMPPRHGKSELVTVRYAAWRLRREPTMNTIIAGYNQKLADRFSRKVKNILYDSAAIDAPKIGSAGAKISELSPSSISVDQCSSVDENVSPRPGVSEVQTFELPYLPESNVRPRKKNTASEWETRAGGSVKAVGVGAGVTGFGAQLVIIDDPVKNRAEAESQTYRDRCWNWYKDDIYTRLEPNAAVILIQTRWHEDDLAGRLINEMKNGGEEWEVVSLPAIAERQFTAEAQRRRDKNVRVGSCNFVVKKDTETTKLHEETRNEENPLRLGDSALKISEDWREHGQALCPERYDVDALRRIEKKLGSYSFAALYQQNPVPADGGIFKRSWFTRIVERAPDGLQWHRGYDLAVSTSTTADHTASFRLAKDKECNIYIADGYRARIEYPEQRRYVIDRMQNEKDTVHGIESALHGQALVQDIHRETRSFRVALRSIKTDKDKVSRALLWAAKAEAGKIILVRGPWIEEFIEEVCGFPSATHDDQVDAVSLAFRMISERRKISAGF